MSAATPLKKSLGPFRGTALMLNIVIGAGLLTLPGLAVKVAGEAALAAWALCAAAALPLLAVFVVLGRRYPDAGGVASYARRGFGPFGARASAFLFLGAVAFGLPSIALTGGHYLATQFGGSAHLYALLLILAATLPHMMPGEGAARAMGIVASAVLAALLVFLAAGFVGLANAPARPPSPGALDPAAILAPFMMLFFAFTGWEVGAGVAEEFENPRRDYPFAMLASFALATALYLAMGWLAQNADLAGAYEAPFVTIVRPVLGEYGALAVALVAALIVFANLAGAVWGVSRMVFGLAREGNLPRLLATTRDGRPLAAVAATVASLVAVLAADRAGAFGLEALLALAGQNFLILYAVAAAALIVLSRSLVERVLGLFVVALAAVLLVLEGAWIVYPLALVAAAALVEGGAAWRRRARPAEGPIGGNPAPPA